MCSSVDPRRTGNRLLAAGVATALVGCARPAGTLFPAMERPYVWPPPPDPPRIELVGMLSSSADLKPARSSAEVLRAAFRGPRPPIPFSAPLDVAVDASRWVAVADGSARAVHLLDLQTRDHTLVSGFGKERFGTPTGVCWADGRLFVTDAKRAEVIELDRTGRFVRSFGKGALNRPVGIDWDPVRERLYVVDGGGHRIMVYTPRGQETGRIGHRGSEPGTFNFPTHVAVFDGRIAVADSGNFRVQILEPSGEVIRTIGHKGDAAGDFSLPKGVAFDRDGHLYVVDAHFENVQVFDEAGRLLLAFGEEGRGPGRFSLPAGLTFDDQDRLWVADSGNRRLQVFRYRGTGP